METKNKTILVVEDDSATAFFHKRFLENNSFNVIIVSNGEDTVKTVDKDPAIDLILMDIHLGDGMDGTEAAEIILKKHDLPVLFISSYTDPEMVARVEGISSYGYVVKNSGKDVLLASIKMAFRLHEAIIENKKKQKDLEKQTNALNQSIKELNCLYSISETAEKYMYSLSEILRKTVNLLPSAMQFPEISWARIIHSNDVYVSDGFNETGYKIASNIYYRREVAGIIEIFTENKNSFLSGEHKLVNSVSELIGRIITKQYLEKDILQISERERIMIGQNLHDSVGQNLTGAAFLFQVIMDNIAKGVTPETEQLEVVKNLIDETKNHIRLLSGGLAPVNIEKDGIITALSELCQRVEEVYKIHCELIIDNIKITDNTIATHIFYIIQESLNNSFKHGRAKNIEISIKKKTDVLEITIEDDGKGLNKIHPEEKGLGLEFMKHRVNIIGGKIDFSFIPDKGATIHCFLNSARWCI